MDKLRVMTVGVMALSSVMERAPGGSASPADQVVTARSGNVLFRMPKNWTRRDTGGTTLLMPPELPEGKWFELRLAPGEESTASPEQALERHVAMLKERYPILQSTPVSRSRHRRGWDAASMALTVNVAPAGQEQPDLRFWVIYAARPSGRIEVLHYVSNDYDVYLQQSKTVERFIDDMSFANLIVLAEGTPKLTELLVNETTDFLEWLLDVPFADDQRRVLRNAIVDVWKRKAQAEIDTVLQIVNLRRQVAGLEAAKADFARAQVQEGFIAGLRKDPSEVSRMLVQVYDAGHRPIADGPPPLTRQSADAMLESIYFMASILEDGQTAVPTKEEKDQWAAKLAEQYAKMPEAQRDGIAQMPMIWAALRWAWPTLPDAEKRRLQEQFGQFEPVQRVRESIAAARKAKDEGFAATMERMQRSHESFMMLSNLSSQMHMTNMAMISNIGGGGWRYEYRYR